MLREIRLYGQLAKFVGKRRFLAAVDTAGEAVRFLIANFPGIEAHISEPGRYYRVKVGDHAIDGEDLHGPVGSNAISIVPVIGGAGGGIGRVCGVPARRAAPRRPMRHIAWEWAMVA